VIRPLVRPSFRHVLIAFLPFLLFLSVRECPPASQVEIKRYCRGGPEGRGRCESKEIERKEGKMEKKVEKVIDKKERNTKAAAAAAAAAQWITMDKWQQAAGSRQQAARGDIGRHYCW